MQAWPPQRGARVSSHDQCAEMEEFSARQGEGRNLHLSTTSWAACRWSTDNNTSIFKKGQEAPLVVP